MFSGLEFRTDLWDQYSTAAPAQRRQYGALSNTARKAYKAYSCVTASTQKRCLSGASAPACWMHGARSGLADALQAYNHAKRLKTLRGLTPHEFVYAQWQKNPAIFAREPAHLTLGLYT